MKAKYFPSKKESKNKSNKALSHLFVKAISKMYKDLFEDKSDVLDFRVFEVESQWFLDSVYFDESIKKNDSMKRLFSEPSYYLSSKTGRRDAVHDELFSILRKTDSKFKESLAPIFTTFFHDHFLTIRNELLSKHDRLGDLKVFNELFDLDFIKLYFDHLKYGMNYEKKIWKKIEGKSAKEDFYTRIRHSEIESIKISEKNALNSVLKWGDEISPGFKKTVKPVMLKNMYVSNSIFSSQYYTHGSAIFNEEIKNWCHVLGLMHESAHIHHMKNNYEKNGYFKGHTDHFINEFFALTFELYYLKKQRQMTKEDRLIKALDDYYLVLFFENVPITGLCAEFEWGMIENAPDFATSDSIVNYYKSLLGDYYKASDLSEHKITEMFTNSWFLTPFYNLAYCLAFPLADKASDHLLWEDTKFQEKFNKLMLSGNQYDIKTLEDLFGDDIRKILLNYNFQ